MDGTSFYHIILNVQKKNVESKNQVKQNTARMHKWHGIEGIQVFGAK